MKKILILASLAMAGLSGCVSTSSTAPAPTVAANVNKIAPFITQAAQTAVPLILNKNPQYASVVASVATAIPAAFASGNLDATSISQAITLIGTKAGLNSEVQTAIAAALLDGVTWYQSTYGAQVASATDPNVKTLLVAFATGVSNGVTLWQQAQPKS